MLKFSVLLTNVGYQEFVQKSVFLDLTKNGWRLSFVVKATYFTYYLSYLYPRLKVSS